ncbi:hypothetical protein SSS_01817 [Sarcoptes scabiei]|nr:hypothetical protein SSS_01817 [Sarcoptes scabiei]
MNEILPEQMELKEKMNEARIRGDSVEFARLSAETMSIYKRRGVNPLKTMLSQFVQAPVFITFFFTLRKMTSHPVESLKTGGILWFENLTIADPFCALPIITSLTLLATLEVSFRSGMNPNQTPVIKYGARAIPIVVAAFTYNFPSAIMLYWCTNNFISLTQVLLLRNDKIRELLNIPKFKVNPNQLSVNTKTFKQHFNETMDNAKINRLLQERKNLDEINFKKAGIGPIQRTFKKN